MREQNRREELRFIQEKVKVKERGELNRQMICILLIVVSFITLYSFV